ncbi:MAG TPA: 50S ribosomal protein L31e [archaeon]|nr:50S ribosomal protein L31e [archaeon]
MAADEKIYTIPLRDAFKKAKGRRVPYAARLVRSFLKTHTKAETVKIGPKLNAELWSRSIAKPPRRVRVKTVREGNVVKAELLGFDYVDFKTQPKVEKKDMKEKLMERLGPKAVKNAEEDKKIDGLGEKPADAKHVEKHEVGESR